MGVEVRSLIVPLVLAVSGAGPSRAAPEFADDFELGGLTPTTNPMGRWTQITSLQGGNMLSASRQSARRGNFGLLCVDGQLQSGAGNEGQLSRTLTARTGDRYVRAWFRLRASNNQGNVDVLAIESDAANNQNITFLRLTNPGAVLHHSVYSAPGYGNFPTSISFGLGSWYLIEAAVTGVGTPTGTSRFWVDGTLVSTRTDLDWTGLQLLDVSTAVVFSADRRFTGTMDWDDFRVSATPMASRLSLSGPASASTGECVPFTVTSVSSIGAETPADENLDLGFMQSGLTASLHSDAACQQPLGAIEIPADTSAATLYLRSTSPGTLDLTATHSDLLSSAPLSITFTGPALDGGSDADGGLGPLHLKVGCSTGGEATTLWAFLALAGLLRRRSARTR